jgi:multiple sugar transport system permease protein
MNVDIAIPIAKPRQATRGAWVFASPGGILLFLFLALPFLMALGYSFTDQRLVSSDDMATEFVGFRNYLRLFDDDSFFAALKNNFMFVVIVAPLQSAFALLLAVLVNKSLAGSKIFRTIYFMPVATTMAVVAVVWS